MSRKFSGPVQTQMAVGALKNPLKADGHVSPRLEGRQPAGRRRVFVQTDTGCVLGFDLDRGDNAHTVKRRLQVVLNIPADRSSLTFGDMVLENDLTAIRKDSPLLLSRNNMHRSSSTPCLSPSAKDIQQKDKSGPIEVLGHSDFFDSTRLLVKDIVKAIKNGVEPLPVQGGLGGAYYFRNNKSECVAIIKPTDEEPFAPNNPKGFVGKALGQPGFKRSVRVGETGIREVAAYLLDYDHFANVPPTALVKITHSIFNVNDGMTDSMGNSNKPRKKRLVSKIASFQQFIPHDFDASDHGTSSFPVSAVHRIGILDVRIFNTDRHAGNLLVKKLDGVGKFGMVELIPIDHGLSLPESLDDPYFEWIHWPQASIPFTEDELEYIRNLDPAKDCEMLRKELPMIREACLRVLVLCTIFLKEAAGYGLCLAEIGEMMSREFHGGEEEPSELEVVCLEARKTIADEILSCRSDSGGEDEFVFDIDETEDHDWELTPKMKGDELMSRSPSAAAAASFFGMGFGNARNPLSRLEESIEEGFEESEDDVEDGGGKVMATMRPPTGHEKMAPAPVVSKLSMSLKNMIFGDTKPQKFSGGMKLESSGGSMGGGNNNTSYGHQSANGQMPESASFVTLADMSEEEWGLFLEKFKELLYPAFVQRKLATGQRQRQRMGTSCQF